MMIEDSLKFILFILNIIEWWNYSETVQYMLKGEFSEIMEINRY